jgi:hypothetical protein
MKFGLFGRKGKRTMAESGALVVSVTPLVSKFPLPRLSTHELHLLETWHERCLDKTHDAEAKARDMYNWIWKDDFMRFMQREATEDVSISESDMTAFLKNKGYRHNFVCGTLHFHGVRLRSMGSRYSSSYPG